MLLNLPIANLLLRWEQLRTQGQIVTPEELCRDCPELLGELVNRLSSLQTTIHAFHGTPPEFTGSMSESTLSGPAGLDAVGDYQILSELGYGGMGVVFQAYDYKRQGLVALKTLQRIDAAALYRLKQEFRTLAEITHPNLVGLYELISCGHQCSIAMELIEGGHFLAYIRSSTGVEEDVRRALLPVNLAGNETDTNVRPMDLQWVATRYLHTNTTASASRFANWHRASRRFTRTENYIATSNPRT